MLDVLIDKGAELTQMAVKPSLVDHIAVYQGVNQGRRKEKVTERDACMHRFCLNSSGPSLPLVRFVSCSPFV